MIFAAVRLRLDTLVGGACPVCRNIKTLFNFEPPATDDEIEAAATQFVRKISGYQRPSQANEVVFERAIREVQAAARRLVDGLETSATPKNREVEAEKARARNRARFGRG